MYRSLIDTNRGSFMESFGIHGRLSAVVFDTTSDDIRLTGHDQFCAVAMTIYDQRNFIIDHSNNHLSFTSCSFFSVRQS